MNLTIMGTFTWSMITNNIETRYTRSSNQGKNSREAQVDVAIVNYNTRELLRDCLRLIYEDKPGQVFVVDNASNDGSQAMIQTQFPGCQLIANRTNVGYSRAANQAIQASTSKCVLLLNSDTQIPQGTLQTLGSYLESHPEVGIVGPRVLGTDGQLQPSCFPFPTLPFLFMEFSGLNRLISRIPLVRGISPRTCSHSKIRAVPWILGAALAIRREAYDTVNGFDPTFFMYFEETDLCYRMWRKGWQIHFSPAVEITHLGGASTQQRRIEMVVQFYSSLALFYRQHYAPAHAAAMIALIRGGAMLRWLRDQAAVHVQGSHEHQVKLVRNLETWQTILQSRWERQGNE